MALHIDIDDPKHRNAAAEILRRHDDGAAEANITSAVRDFLIVTALVKSEEMAEESPPSDESRSAVDLKALDTFIEFKRRIGTASGGAPNPQYVEQLDDYLAQALTQGRVRMGVLTDGKRWLLRWHNAGPVRMAPPYAFTLEEPDQWIGLYEWLRDSALVSLEGVRPDREGIEGVLNRLREAVTGIDVHPVAVHLARAAWTLAARPAINAASAAGFDASLSIPVYLGDALQLRFRTGDMFAEHNITVQVEDEENTELVFPVSLVERAEAFDALMGDVSASIERGDDPFLALDDNEINDPTERQVISHAIAAMQRLHDRGRNHIWAYYARNMVRPVVLSRSKVDVVIGNPPWINYNQTADILRDELLNLCRNAYGIWAGGRYATHQDVAGLFFSRSVDLYLKDGGVIGFVLPHSALQAGQYSKWRSGQWRARKSGPSVSVDFAFKPAWDLEQLKPNSFFPIPASVAFARKLSQDTSGKPLGGRVERWRGRAGANDVRREPAGIAHTGTAGESPYGGYSRQGATIVPRCLFFVEETTNTAIVQAAPTITVNPRRGSLDKAPWKDLDLTEITGQTVERRHLFDVHLGETIVPYVALAGCGKRARRTDVVGGASSSPTISVIS